MSFFPDTSTAVSVGQLNNLSAPALTDLQVINRPGAGDYNVTNAQLIALMRTTPLAPRSATLPAVLTAADNDRTIVLTGSTGALSADGTVGPGFRAFVYNGATGSATYSGISGLFGTTTLASGSAVTLFHTGTALLATAAATASTSAATAYTSALGATSGAIGNPVQVSVTPTSGVWPTGTIITFASSGGTGAFSSTTASAPASSSAPLTVTFTPSTANTFTISTTNNQSLTNPSNLSYVASAATATTYSMSESATVGQTGVAVTLSFAPSGGSWPGSTTLTPAASGVSGTFSPTTLSPTGTSTVTCTFTPSAGGTVTFSVTNNQSLANPPNITYTANATATAYTQTLSQVNGGVGSSVRLTVTPTSGGWPNATTITPSITPSSGSFSPASFSPQAGSTAGVVFTYTPIQAGSFAINTSTSPALTNTSGAQNYLVAAATATAYTTAISATTGAVNTPITITYTPNPTNSVWPIGGTTITPTASPGTGTFNFSSFQPSAGTNTPLSGTFSPSAVGTYLLNSTTSPALTNTTGQLSYAATGSAPTYPNVTTGGVTLQAIYDANAGVTVASGLITALADQSSNHNDLTASAGVTVGPSFNGFPTITFAGTSYSVNSGLRSTGSWLSNMGLDSTIVLAFVTGPAVGGGVQYTVLNAEPTNLNFSGDIYLAMGGSGDIHFAARPAQNFSVLAAATRSTLYKLIIRYKHDNGSGASTVDYWLNNGTKQTVTGQSIGALSLTNFAIGQAASSGANSGYGLGGFNGQFLEAHLFQGAISDSDATTFQTYLTSKWGS